ncbi:Uncharacterized protein OBRU01_03287 [Operophtera brumata]|uniref:Uncharacterized protein n=1 Tax=Operophtera brumata TaxID=104452 RepID=A0A0L7LR46_OPEBR|nr:Uncharacterized protein OBRU01_03287 [Operophtera brumata]
MNIKTHTNIKQNLGIVICLDKHQRDLSELMERYPMLYSDAHFVWLDRWSDNTLREMPALVIQRFEMIFWSLLCTVSVSAPFLFFE